LFFYEPLAVIGENPRSTDPAQHEVNQRTEQYSAIIKQIAGEEGVCYLPFYERMYEQIAASGAPSLEGG
jgi:hypothetical protein